MLNNTDEKQNLSSIRQHAEFAKLFWLVKSPRKIKELGPDGIRMEFITWLSDDDEAALLTLSNKWWKGGEAPAELYHARVATIYKEVYTDIASYLSP